MGPGGTVNFYSTQSNQTNFFNSLGFSFETAIVSGNPELKSESSDTWTLGAVLRSPFKGPLSQFTASVDYFKITVADAIGVVQLNSLYGGVYRHCYDPTFNTTLDPNDPFCQQIPRDQITGQKDANPRLSYSNVGGIISQGIDVSFNWSALFSDMGMSFIPGRFTYSLNGNYMIKDARQAAPGEPFEEFTGLSGFGSFRWTIYNTFGWTSGARMPRSTGGTSRARRATATSPAWTSASRNRCVRHLRSVARVRAHAVTAAARWRGQPVQQGAAGKRLQSGRRWPGTVRYNPGTIAGGGAYDLLGRRYFIGVKLSL